MTASPEIYTHGFRIDLMRLRRHPSVSADLPLKIFSVLSDSGLEPLLDGSGAIVGLEAHELRPDWKERLLSLSRWIPEGAEIMVRQGSDETTIRFTRGLASIG